MIPQYHARRAVVVIATAVSLVSPPFLDVFRAQAQAPTSTAKPATPKAKTATPTAASTASPSTVAAPVDGGWPKSYSTPSGGVILIHTPQIASWADQRLLVLYSAVSYNAKGASKAALGAIKAETATRVSLEQRQIGRAHV